MKSFFLYYLLILAMFLWGGGWSALKILTQTQSMEVIVFWRFFLMSFSFLPILYFYKRKVIFKSKSIVFIFFGSLLNILFMIFSYFGISQGLAGSGSVIITTLSPLFTFLIMSIVFKRSISLYQYFGLIIGLIGGIVLLKLYNFSLFLVDGNFFLLFAALIWALITILAQYSHKYISPIEYSFFISIFSTFISFLFCSDIDLLSVFHEGIHFWLALIYLAVLGQTLATTIFFIASGKLGSELTSSFMFLVPVFALLIAAFLLDEEIERTTLIGGALSFIAIFFINNKRVK